MDGVEFFVFGGSFEVDVDFVLEFLWADFEEVAVFETAEHFLHISIFLLLQLFAHGLDTHYGGFIGNFADDIISQFIY